MSPINDQLLLQNISAITSKIDVIYKEINGLRKLQEQDSRANDIDHQNFKSTSNTLLQKILATEKEIQEQNVTQGESCLKHNQYFLDQLLKQESDLKQELMRKEADLQKEIDSIRDRNFFAYAWDWMKKDLKYVITFAAFLNIDWLVKAIKYIIEIWN